MKAIWAAIMVSVPLMAISSLTEASPILSVSSPSSVTSGETFTVDVGISGVSDLYGWQFDLDFTPGVLSAGSVTEGSFLAGGGATFFIGGVADNIGGAVTANADTLLTAISGVSGTGTLASFDFTAGSGGTGTFTLSNALLLDSSLSPIDASLTGAAVTVTPSTSVPEPATDGLLALALATLAMRSGRASPRWRRWRRSSPA